MSIRYQTICSNLLRDLPPRTTNVIERRFGLKKGARETLEAIGQDYGITRERVRQIEEEGFSKIRPRIKNCQKVLQYFHNRLDSLGGFKKEDILLNSLGGRKYQNQAFFLLTLADGLKRYPEDKDFHPLWTRKKESVSQAKKVINSTINKLGKEKRALTLDELFKIQKAAFSKILDKKSNKNVFCSCLEISKKIQENPEGQLGLRDWVEINPRGIKDKAYLVLKKEGGPLHFSKVALLIENSPCFDKKKTHTATVHNELIKDSRFILVGRGLYGLKEWGYEPGVVRDVILKILQKSKKSLSKDEIVKEVSNQRIVKANTILLNLQDKNYFLKNEQGKYRVRRV